MEYYKLDYNTNSKISGTFPQAECMNLQKAHSIKYNEFNIEKDFSLNFILGSKAKITDVMSQAAITGNGFLVSERLKALLDDFNLMNHLYYPAIIETSRGLLKYYWLHLVDNKMIKSVNFQKSLLYRTKFGFREEGITLKSFEKYQQTLENLDSMSGIESDYIKLLNTFDKSLDLFIISEFHSRPYANQRLIDSLLKNKISGLTYESSPIASCQ